MLTFRQQSTHSIYCLNRKLQACQGCCHLLPWSAYSLVSLQPADVAFGALALGLMKSASPVHATRSWTCWTCNRSPARPTLGARACLVQVKAEIAPSACWVVQGDTRLSQQAHLKSSRLSINVLRLLERQEDFNVHGDYHHHHCHFYFHSSHSFNPTYVPFIVSSIIYVAVTNSTTFLSILN